MEYNKVPNIITGKDLDYLSDMFNWNIESYKFFNNILKNVTDAKIRSLIKTSVNIFDNNMCEVLSIIKEGLNESN